MKKFKNFIVAAPLIASSFFLLSSSALATSPMISSIPNQTIQLSGQTDVVSFSISDNENSPSDLTLTYRSSNRNLVPADDDHIILGGFGSSRTIQVIPAPNTYGTSRITVTVTDLDGDSSSEPFDVEIIRPIR